MFAKAGILVPCCTEVQWHLDISALTLWKFWAPGSAALYRDGRRARKLSSGVAPSNCFCQPVKRQVAHL